MHFFFVGFDAYRAVVVERHDRVSQQANRLQEVVNAHRHKHVQFKVALGSSHTNCHIVTHYLYRNHGHGFALGGVHLTGHNGRAGFVFGDEDFTQTVTGTGSQPPYVVGNFHHIGGKGFQSAVSKDQFVFGSKGVEFVFCGNKFFAGDFAHRFGNRHVKPFGGVQPGTNGGTAQSQFFQSGQSDLQHFLVFFQRRAPAADFLAKRNGGSILQVGTTGFYNALVFFFQPFEGVHQQVDGGEQFVLDSQHGGDMHRGGEGIVGRLAHIDVVIGVEQFFSCDFVAPIGDYFVGVHIGLGTRTGLPHHQGEVVVELPCHHFVTGLADGIQFFVGHFFGFQRVVGHGRRFFQNPESVGDFTGHNLVAHPDAEVFTAPLGLCCPVFVSRHFYLAHGVMFNTIFHSAFPLF